MEFCKKLNEIEFLQKKFKAIAEIKLNWIVGRKDSATTFTLTTFTIMTLSLTTISTTLRIMTANIMTPGANVIILFLLL